MSFKTTHLGSVCNQTDEAGPLGKFSSFLKNWRKSGEPAHGMLEGGLRCEWLRFQNIILKQGYCNQEVGGLFCSDAV